MSPKPKAAIEYPETDGKPMAETDKHRDLMLDLIDQLKSHYQADPAVYVSGNLLLYYEEGNPRKSVAPDVFVVHGVGKQQRRVYLLWQEGRAPQVVFEISSRSTAKEDLQGKRQLYAQLGVAEYYLFDPEYDYLQGLTAYRLNAGAYEEAAVRDGAIHSPVLGLDVVDTGATLRLRDPQTGQFLATHAELFAARRQAEADAAKAAAQATRAIEQAARFAAKLRALGIDPEQV